MTRLLKYFTVLNCLLGLLQVNEIVAQKIELGMAVVSSYGDTSNISSKVAKVYDVRRNGIAPRGEDWAEYNPNIIISPSTWTLENLGEIFGLAIDSFGNVLMSATDVYKLDAQFGNNPGSYSGPAGTGGVYMANADDLSQIQTIISTLNSPILNELPSNNIPNTGGIGNGIGNIAYDRKHHQLFLTNLEDGRIYRIDLDLPTPQIVSVYDPFELDDAQIGMTDQKEQLWGIGIYTDTSVNQTKVYFTKQHIENVQLSTVYSISLDINGEFDASYDQGLEIFHGSVQMEIELNSSTSNISRITDLSFSDDGRMLLAERGHAHRAGIYEFERNANNWNESNHEYSVGSWNLVVGYNGKNAAGGVDYGYRENGNNPYGFCDSMVWSTANYMQTPSSGSGFYYGLEGINSKGNLPVTHIPLYQSNAHTDIYIDFDDPSGSQSNLQVGDVEIFRVSCASFGGAPINETLVCNNLLQVSLDTMGLAYVNIDLVTEGDGSNPCWQLRMYDNTGRLIEHNILTCDHVGTRVDFIVKDTCTKISCWGKIDVEDKYAPQISCGSDTVRCQDDKSPEALGFPVPFGSHVNKTADPTIFSVSNWDSCGDVQLQYIDEVIYGFDCDFDYKFILRHWIAQDEAGNMNSCDDSIYIHIPNLILDTIGLNDIYLSCDDTWPTLADGNPSPDLTGWPIPSDCNTLIANFEDTSTPYCGAAEKILRKWTLLDWCAKNGNPKQVVFYQFIEIADHIVPDLYCKNNGSIVDTVGTDYYLCSGSYQLPVPQNINKGDQITDSSGIFVIGECSEWSYTVKHIRAISNTSCIPNSQSATLLGASRDLNDAPFSLNDIPQGCNWFFYEISDACGNSSQCTIKVVVVDDLGPSVICDAHTKVSLLGPGLVRVNAISFDDGTIDNCELDSFSVRRMDGGMPCGWNITNFNSYVEFCCADIGKSILVEFKATDKAGNEGVCMVEVQVEDKIKPRIVAPTDITIDCRYQFDINELGQHFGKIVDDKIDVEDIFILNDPHYSAGNNWLAGTDGYIQENCDQFTWIDSVIIDLHCGIGTIRRIFTVTDKSGLIDTDEQLIIIEDVDPFDENDIDWPDDILDNPIETDCVNGISTDPSNTGTAKAKSNDKCTNLAFHYDDKFLFGEDSACYKIIRTWTVIDWCQFDRDTNPGWEHRQYIKVANHIAPIFAQNFCEDKVFCDSTAIKENDVCKGFANLKGDAQDDCTPDEDLVWEYNLDIGNSGTWGALVSGRDASDYYPVGFHRIRWTVTDLCGNVNTCFFSFEILECKAPTPYCRNGVVTVVMPSNGLIEVNVDILDLGSFDNCTNKEDLIFSFTPDGNTQTILYNCDSLEGKDYIEKTVEFWVIDEMGNKDHCTSIIKIQNNGACGSNLNGVLSGELLTFDGNEINSVVVSLAHNGQVIQGPKLADGSYNFTGLALNEDYIISAMSRTNYGHKVSTRDLVAIKKHLLGIQEFEYAWQHVAADANNSNTISTFDISAFRKIILGKDIELKKQDSWLFYNQNVDLDDVYELFNHNNEFVVNDLKENEPSKTFYGLKVGDVNGDLNGWFDRSKIKTRSGDFQLIGTYFIQENQQQIIEVRTSDLIQLEGLQFTLELQKGIQIIDIASQKLNIGSANFAMFENKVTFLWSGAKAIKFDADDILFNILIEGDIRKDEIDFIKMTSGITDAQIFYPNEIEEDLSLSIQNRDSENVFYNLKIAPNPFMDLTSFELILENEALVNITIMDCNGKIVHDKQQFLPSGKNIIEIEESKFTSGPGIYFSEIRINGSLIRKKLVKL